MKIWLIKDGENLPIEPDARKMRTWLLAEELIRRGHRIEWWTSTFSHAKKTLFFPQDQRVDCSPSLTLRLLHAGSYRRNLSLGRYRHHRRLGRRFREAAEKEAPPDLILAAFPIIDLAYEAVRAARRFGVPVIVDIRDLWPDTFLDFCPSALRPFARAALWKDFRMTANLLREADAFAAISHGCLAWGCAKAKRPRNDRTRVFYLGYPRIEHASPDRAASLGALGETLRGKVVFTYIGSFGRSYDLETVIRAARSMHRRGEKGLHIVLAGAGEQLDRLRSLASDLPNLSLTGWLDQGQITELLRRSHAGIVPGPAVQNAMPNKVFEYLSEGLGLLSSVKGELQDLIETHGIGFSYPKGNAENLAAHMLAIGRDPAMRSRTRKNARDLFEREFRAETVYRAYADFVEETAAASRTASAM